MTSGVGAVGRWTLFMPTPVGAAGGRLRDDMSMMMTMKSRRIGLASAGRASAVGSVERCRSFPQVFLI
jgi:hypothetical protein